MHFEWWCFLRTVYIQRCALHRSPLTVTWIPAHVLEELPCELISQKLAQQFKTTWGDIFCNRKADWYAKKACREFAKSGNVNDLCQQISEWQHWLTLVSSEIAKRDDSDLIPQSDENHQHGPQLFVSPGIAPGELTLAHPTTCFEAVLPKWFWQQPDGTRWVSDFPSDASLHSYAKISKTDWDNAIKFFQSVEWILHNSHKTAFLELAFMSWENGFVFEKGQNPADCATLLRKCANQAIKYHADHRLHPGEISSKAKSNGKTFPAGIIVGAYPRINQISLKRLALHFFAGRSLRLKDWKGDF